MVWLFFLVLLFLPALGRGEGGKFVCAMLCAPCLLAFLTALGRYHEPNPKPGLGWIVLVSGLLTIGFGLAAFQSNRRR